MASYMLIESRDPWECGEVKHHLGLAVDLVKAGNSVTLFLVQNGVLPVRQSVMSGMLQEAMQHGVKVLADEFSLRERGIREALMVPEVVSASLDVVVNHMAKGGRTVWC